jgi:hypothetical protein
LPKISPAHERANPTFAETESAESLGFISQGPPAIGGASIWKKCLKFSFSLDAPQFLFNRRSRGVNAE